jgi:hypothetical protein
VRNLLRQWRVDITPCVLGLRPFALFFNKSLLIKKKKKKLNTKQVLLCNTKQVLLCRAKKLWLVMHVNINSYIINILSKQ